MTEMRVVGFCGYSGSGKTTLVEQLVTRLGAGGARIAVVKHAHHDFDIDRPGKDSWRHRRAGAAEIVVASRRRMAKIREYGDDAAAPDVHDLIAELLPCDWVLVEGFKHAAIAKLEVWRAVTAAPLLYPADGHVLAVCTDLPARLPVPTALPVLDLGDPAAIAAFLGAHADRFVYGGRPCGDLQPPASFAGTAGIAVGVAR
jgi:molybdopterin-guanine dinucleotide biosynthesis adapter protein